MSRTCSTNIALQRRFPAQRPSRPSKCCWRIATKPCGICTAKAGSLCRPHATAGASAPADPAAWASRCPHRKACRPAWGPWPGCNSPWSAVRNSARLGTSWWPPSTRTGPCCMSGPSLRPESRRLARLPPRCPLARPAGQRHRHAYRSHIGSTDHPLAFAVGPQTSRFISISRRTSASGPRLGQEPIGRYNRGAIGTPCRTSKISSNGTS